MMNEAFLHDIAAIRSGGQTGADRGALDAARQAGVAIRGWCPLGGWAEDMLEPPGLLAAYPELIEAPSPDPAVRTEWNVRDSDATLIVCPGPVDPCSGTAATIEFARRYGKPFLVCDGTDCSAVADWIRPLASAHGEGLDLNVAGPRESGRPGVYELTRCLIARLLSMQRTEEGALMDDARKLELLGQLVAALALERGEDAPAGTDAQELWDAFRALVNTRPPWPAGSEFLAAQDELLQGMIAETGVHRPDEALRSASDDRLALWRGDITTLAVDAIVNAANSQLLGCWVPGHFCIDNAIHTFAGVQLRIECARIMEEQGHEEPTGSAKVTPAYNLPARYIIHTVGPIAAGHPTDEHRAQLASSYRSCLDAAASCGARTIAFCCISTGVFGFPQAEAAQIAVGTVRAWLDAHASADAAPLVIFNVFSEASEAIYRALLQRA